MPAYWFKPEDRVHPDWFGPLQELSTRVAQTPHMPQIKVDHFLYAARIEREGFPVLHVYRHFGTRKFINVDEVGALWRYTARDSVGCERYAPLGTVADGVHGADLFRGNLLAQHLLSGADPDARIPAMPPPRPADRDRRRPPSPPAYGAPAASTVNPDAGAYVPTYPVGDSSDRSTAVADVPPESVSYDAPPLPPAVADLDLLDKDYERDPDDEDVVDVAQPLSA